MRQKIIYIIIIVIVLIVAFFLFINNSANQQKIVPPTDYKNAEYTIDGRPVKLTNGLSEVPVSPGSASKIITRYFGNEVTRDLNGDSKDDAVFLLTQETGGSGTFFYVVAAVKTDNGYIGSQGFLLGDRIAPQTTEISQNPNHENVIVVNYADRAPGEPFTTQPSIGKSVWLKLDPETLQFGEVVQNFEGEADPSKMTLSMKKWTWINTLYNDGQKVTPKQPGKFTISFLTNGTFTATTDCNSASGGYVASGNKISFGNISSTLMYCEGSEESIFTKFLSDSQTYLFTSKGELILNLKFDSGSVVFK